MARNCNGYIFGTERIVGIVVTNQTTESAPQYQAQAKDETGETVAMVMGAPTGTCTISGYMNNDARTPTINSSFDLDGRTFWCDKVTLSKSSEDFQKIEVTGRFWYDVENAC
jgi:hypothetical protein